MLVALSLAALTSLASAEQSRSVTIVNATGYTLFGLAADSSTLPDGGSITLTLQGSCRGDLAAGWSGGSDQLVWHALALCGVREIRLGLDDATGETTAFIR